MAAATPGRVFIAQDHAIPGILDRMAADLRADGIEVVRGPVSIPGRLGVLAPDMARDLLHGVEVAMFTSRWRCDRAVMAAGPRLRAVLAPAIGVETIDVAAATELGIAVGHAPTPQNYTSMAESTVMLMLNLLYGLRRTEAVMRGQRRAPAWGEHHARMLQGKTVGIVGLGRIGHAVVERLRVFGVRFLVHSPHADRGAAADDLHFVDLPELMAGADLVGVFVAVRDDNRGLIDARMLRCMQPHAYLVNVSRGDAIDEPALVQALQQGWLAGAALDTFAVEPLPDHSPLRGMDNVILTPHLVGHTQEAQASLVEAARENFHRVLQGGLPVYCRNPRVAMAWAQRPGMLRAT